MQLRSISGACQGCQGPSQEVWTPMGPTGKPKTPAGSLGCPLGHSKVTQRSQEWPLSAFAPKSWLGATLPIPF
eukprot:359699-Chlamydomonas_euryale.AAC.6